MGSNTSPTGLRTWMILWKATQSVQANARRNIDGLGLGLTDFAVLEVLLHKGPLPVNVIGSKVLLTSGSVTTAIDRLEVRSLVERGPHAHDRRARIVHLTDKGRKLIECAFGAHARAMEDVFSCLSGPERSAFIETLKTLGHYAQNLLEGEK